MLLNQRVIFQEPQQGWVSMVLPDGRLGCCGRSLKPCLLRTWWVNLLGQSIRLLEFSGVCMLSGLGQLHCLVRCTCVLDAACLAARLAGYSCVLCSSRQAGWLHQQCRVPLAVCCQWWLVVPWCGYLSPCTTGPFRHWL